MSKQQKSTVHKIADDLAAKARILRASVEEPEPTDTERALKRLTSLSTFETSKAERLAKETKDDTAIQARATVAPLIERARRRIDDMKALREAHEVFVNRVLALNFDALRQRMKLRVSSMGSLDSSITRVNLLRRAATEAHELLVSDDRDLLAACAAVEPIQDLDSKDAEIAIGTLRYYLQLAGGAPDGIRSRIRGICRILADLGTDLTSADAVDQELQPKLTIDDVNAVEPRITGAVPSALWVPEPYTPPVPVPASESEWKDDFAQYLDEKAREHGVTPRDVLARVKKIVDDPDQSDAPQSQASQAAQPSPGEPKVLTGAEALAVLDALDVEVR